MIASYRCGIGFYDRRIEIVAGHMLEMGAALVNVVMEFLAGPHDVAGNPMELTRSPKSAHKPLHHRDPLQITFVGNKGAFDIVRQQLIATREHCRFPNRLERT